MGRLVGYKILHLPMAYSYHDRHCACETPYHYGALISETQLYPIPAAKVIIKSITAQIPPTTSLALPHSPEPNGLQIPKR